MARYAIMRLQKRGMSAAAGMARHALREANVTNADPQLRAQNRILVGPKTAAGVMSEIRARLPERRRKDSVPVIEFFIGGSPEALRHLETEHQDRYFEHSLKWIAKRFGGRENIVSAVVHCDETTPHMQVLVVPLLDGKLNAKKLVGNRKQMEDMQTEFAKEAGAMAGLVRGQEKSKAKHTTIRQFYKAIEEAGSKEALPPRVTLPEALPQPGFFSSKADREAFEKREKERAAALAANRKRQVEIERLAALAVAVKGRPARTDLPKVKAEVTKTKAEAEASKKEAELAKAELATLKAQAQAAQKALSETVSQAALVRQSSGVDALKAERDLVLQEYMSVRSALSDLKQEFEQAKRQECEGPDF